MLAARHPGARGTFSRTRDSPELRSRRLAVRPENPLSIRTSANVIKFNSLMLTEVTPVEVLVDLPGRYEMT